MLLKELIEPHGLTPADVATRCGIHTDALDAVIAGRASVTKAQAVQLEHLFGVRAGFWLTLQKDWDNWHLRGGCRSMDRAEV